MPQPAANCGRRVTLALTHPANLNMSSTYGYGNERQFQLHRPSHLDHVNIVTDNLDAMARFYQDVIGLKLGQRPPFAFPGAWLYCGDRAAVHLVGRRQAHAPGPSRINHFAFRATGLAQFVARLRDGGLSHETRLVPGLELTQVNVRDPDGNLIEMAFGAEEKGALEALAEAGATRS